MNRLLSARYHAAGAGTLRIGGADRAAFIQRQSTNDLDRLDAGTHLSTVLTNPAARIVDVLQLFHLDADTLAALTLPGRGPATAFFLKKRVFFNDRVKVEDAGGDFRVFELLGPLDPAALPAEIAPGAPGSVRPAEFEGGTIHVLGLDGSPGPTARFVVPSAAEAAFTAVLEAAGVAAMAADEYEILRIEAGLPGAAAELTEDYTPLETGLGALISDTKGCYTGQEVIARQITYDKITKGLAGIRLGGPVAAGARVLAGEANVGTVTSYARSPGEGHLALGVLKRPHGEPGTVVRVQMGDGFVEGKVVTLPFV